MWTLQNHKFVHSKELAKGRNWGEFSELQINFLTHLQNLTSASIIYSLKLNH